MGNKMNLTVHQYHVGVAEVVGANAATIFYNMVFWCQKNEANGKNIHEGRAWTYNSRSAFGKLFPQFSQQQIKTAIKKLEENDLIVSGNFNKMAMDRTKWYALSDKSISILNNQCIGSEQPTTLGQNNQPIPDSKPDNKPDTYSMALPGVEVPENKKEIDFLAIMDLWNKKLGHTLPRIKIMTPKRKGHIRARIAECKDQPRKMTTIEDWNALFNVILESKFLLGKNDRDWKADFDWILKENKFVNIIEGKYLEDK